MKRDVHRNYEFLSEEGVFKFLDNGFFINENKKSVFIKWIEIKQIIAYNITFYENPILFIDLYTDNEKYTFNEETLGWYQLIAHINTNLITIDKSWYMNNLINSTSSNRIIIYNRN